MTRIFGFSEQGIGGRIRSRGLAVKFLFDLRSPHTYFASERIERSFERVIWEPLVNYSLWSGMPTANSPAGLAIKERARELRLPLVWPENLQPDGLKAAQVAELAVELGRGAEFVLAVGRLAFCGDFDLDEDDVLVEAGAAAGLSQEQVLTAIADSSAEQRVLRRGIELAETGVQQLPVFQIGDSSFVGEEQLEDAARFVRQIGHA